MLKKQQILNNYDFSDRDFMELANSLTFLEIEPN